MNPCPVIEFLLMKSSSLRAGERHVRGQKVRHIRLTEARRERAIIIIIMTIFVLSVLENFVKGIVRRRRGTPLDCQRQGLVGVATGVPIWDGGFNRAET